MDSTLVIWHGYLLTATGSNIYTRNLVDSWVRSGRDVVLVCQERDPALTPWATDYVDLVPVPSGGMSAVGERAGRAPRTGRGRCTIVRPDIGGVLPVYVYDRYEGFEVVTFVDADDATLATYDEAQRGTAMWIVEQFTPAGALINHAVPLPAAVGPVLARAGVPYAVKVHGSELEYAIAHDDRFVPRAQAGLAGAASVLVGSDHIAARTAELVGHACIEGRVHVVPPGVDLEMFHPLPGGSRSAAPLDARQRGLDDLVSTLRAREREQPHGRGVEQRRAVADLVASAEVGAERDLEGELRSGLAAISATYEERHVDAGAADAISSRCGADRAAVVAYVGKLIPQKGAHLVLAAAPLLVERCPDLALLVAGFGPEREWLEAWATALGTGARRAAAVLGRDHPEVAALLADLAADSAASERYWAAAAGLHERIAWLGLVGHDVLSKAWPLCTTSVVPSVLAEAFGMVAAEAAACGAVPVVSDHSGLADAATVIEGGGVAPIRFDPSNPARAVERLAVVLAERLGLAEHEAARQAVVARANVAANWSWDALAQTVADCMCGGHVTT